MITVIMPVYITTEETLELTKAALHSLGEVRLILIDNASTLGGGYLRSIADVYVRNQQNLGYAKAVNQGLQLAGEGMVAVANNDIRVSPNWAQVATTVLADPAVYSCHFRMIGYDEPMMYGNSIVKTGKERWCTSSFFVLNEGWHQLYDEKFFNTYEDWDYWKRIRKGGRYTAYTDRACYQHKHSHTQSLMPNRGEYDQANREYFIKKWGKSAEELFAEEFPDQVMVEYWKGFAI